MAFPTLLGVRSSGNTANTTSTTVLVPDGSNVNGYLVLVIFGKDGTGTITGWGGATELGQQGAQSALRLGVAYRIVDGTEGWDGTDDSFTVTHANEGTAAIVLTYSAWHGTTPPELAISNVGGSSTSADPPSLDPANWAAEDTMWIAAALLDRGDSSFTGFPANYANNQTQFQGGNASGGVTLGIATRNLNASSDDPGTFMNTNIAWNVATIAVRPAAAGASNFPLDAQPGSYSLTGSVAGLLAQRVINASSGNYSINGSPAGLLASRLLNAAIGSYAISGTSAGLLADRVLSADPGSYVVTGFAATLQGPAASFEINAEPGSFTITGAAAGLALERVLNASPGSYSITGDVAGLIRDAVLSASPGSYTIAGSNAGLIADYVLSALAGSYDITGFDATLEGPGAVEIVIRLRTLMGMGQ